MDKSIGIVEAQQAEPLGVAPSMNGPRAWPIGEAAQFEPARQIDELAAKEDADSDEDDILVIVEDWLLPEEVEQVGDVGGQGDDTDGPEVAKKRSVWLSFQELRLAISADSAVKAFKRALASRWRSESVACEPPTPESEWRRLGDEALGLAPILVRPISIDGVASPASDARESTEAIALDAYEQCDMEIFQRKLSTLRQIVEIQQRQLGELMQAKEQIDLASKSADELALLAVKSLRVFHC